MGKVKKGKCNQDKVAFAESKNKGKVYFREERMTKIKRMKMFQMIKKAIFLGYINEGP